MKNDPKYSSIRFWVTGLLLLVGCSDDNILGGANDGTDSVTASDSDSSTSSDGDGDTDGDTGSDTGPDWEACAGETIAMDLIPLDILLALDTSYSMDFKPEGQSTTKWEAIRSAVKRFVASPSAAGLGVGLQYFPVRKICSVDAYTIPAVPVLELPGGVTTLSNSLDQQRMAEGTPMFPMLQGALAYSAQWALDHPDRRSVVVMATDGIPDNTCLTSDPATSNTLDNVEALAASSAAATPSINTYVIGVGSELTALNRISQAGNGDDALLVDLTGDDVEQALLEAFESIRRRSICEYQIEDIAGDKKVDFEKVNVLFSSATITNEPFLFVNTEAGCELASEKGWYYDDQLAPKRILLCPQGCDRIQDNPENQLQIVLGCETVAID